MVRDFKNKSSQFGAVRYRSPKIYVPQKQKEKREIKLPVAFYKFIFFLIVLLALSYYLFLSPQFRIKEMIVEGTNLLSAEDVKAALPQDQNIFRFNVGYNEKKLLAKFPEIKEVQIYRGIPNALKIVVLEREGRVIWQSGETKYLLSSQGEIAKVFPADYPSDLPLIIDSHSLPVVVGDKLVSPNFIAFIVNVFSTFYGEVNIKPTTFEIGETTFDVVLKTDAGFYVKLNSLRSSKKQLENLKTVLMAKRADVHEYVDLRIDGWAYYK